MISRQFSLNRAKTISFLDGLEASTGNGRSLYIPPGLPLPQVRNLLEEVSEPEATPPELAGLAAGSKTGAALFRSQSKQYLILPPFPVSEEHSFQGYATGPLRSMLRHDYRIALILVRLGAYAVGLSQGESLVTSKVGTGLVHGRHRQGGSSAQRFQNRRGEQIDSFLDRVCRHIRERLEPQSKVVDYVVYGGARTTILRLRKQCPFLRQFDDRILPPLLDIPDPRQAVLETAVGRVWSSRIIEWQEEI